MPEFRGRRIAVQLLAAIEHELRRGGVARMRINVLSANTAARSAYTHAGFVPYEILYEKPDNTGRPAVDVCTATQVETVGPNDRTIRHSDT